MFKVKEITDKNLFKFKNIDLLYYRWWRYQIFTSLLLCFSMIRQVPNTCMQQKMMTTMLSGMKYSVSALMVLSPYSRKTLPVPKKIPALELNDLCFVALTYAVVKVYNSITYDISVNSRRNIIY